MKGAVHLYVRGQGIGALVQQIANDGLVAVLARPNKGRPAALIRGVDEVARQAVLAQDKMGAFWIARPPYCFDDIRLSILRKIVEHMNRSVSYRNTVRIANCCCLIQIITSW